MITNLLTITDVQAVLKVSRSKLYELINSGDYAPILHVGTTPRWTEEGLNEQIQRQQEKNKPKKLSKKEK